MSIGTGNTGNSVIIDPITKREVTQTCERCGNQLESPKDDNLYDEEYHGDIERVCSKCFYRACMKEQQIQMDIAESQRDEDFLRTPIGSEFY